MTCKDLARLQSRELELRQVLEAVAEEFRKYGNNFPDGFDVRLFRWVEDAVATSPVVPAKEAAIDWTEAGALMEAAGSAKASGFLAGTTNWAAYVCREMQAAGRRQDSPAAPAGASNAKNLLNTLEQQAHRTGELWERCQGKGWPDSESDEFAALRDVKLPATRAAVLTMLATPAAVEGPSAWAEHYDEIKATLQGAHGVMENLSAMERKVGPLGSHGRGYTHKITKALRHLESMRSLHAVAPTTAQLPSTTLPFDDSRTVAPLVDHLLPPQQTALIENLCARIKAADDAAADNGYMLDSNDCISVLRGTWTGPLANDLPPKPRPAEG